MHLEELDSRWGQANFLAEGLDLLLRELLKSFLGHPHVSHAKAIGRFHHPMGNPSWATESRFSTLVERKRNAGAWVGRRTSLASGWRVRDIAGT